MTRMTAYTTKTKANPRRIKPKSNIYMGIYMWDNDQKTKTSSNFIAYEDRK